MHQELEKLIDLAIADGILTDKKKQVLEKKREELGVDLDEFEMVLEAKLHQRNQVNTQTVFPNPPLEKNRIKSFRMKIKLFFTGCLPVLVLFSCSSKSIKTKDDAIKFLESNAFYDDGAYIRGKSGGDAIKSGFSLSFSDGKVKIGSQTLPYTISNLIENGNSPSEQTGQFTGYEIEFCGSEGYAYGDCIKCYLSPEVESGEPYLSVKGEYITSLFSSKVEGMIKDK